MLFQVNWENEIIVYVYGVWDMFHVGHLKLLERAKSLGSYLVVGVVSDEAVRKRKGKNRPIISQDQRYDVINGLKIVNDVVRQNDFDPTPYIKKYPHKIKILVLGEDQKHIKDFSWYMKSKNVLIVRLERTKDISTSDIIERIKKECS